TRSFRNAGRVAAVLGLRGVCAGGAVAFGASALIAASGSAIAGDVGSEWSVARHWNEALLEAIRKDTPRPPVHARNLFHTSVVMYDAWCAYQTKADPYMVAEVGDMTG